MIQSICFKEKMKLPFESVQRLIASTDMDIRQIINQLELIREPSAKSTTGAGLYNPKKDLKFGPWDVCRKVFSATEHRGMSIHDKTNLFFQDYSFGPLFIQENYPKWTPLAAK
jgi:replication factor C subunit 1